MNLLSIGAAFGLIVAVFQWGWGASLIGVDGTGPIISFFPIFLFAIVFGLSMDYEVFLMSRIHEEWEHRRDATLAVTRGLALTGRVITAAAAIMVTVFASFMIGEDRIIKLFGLGLAAAIFIDAVIIRSVLVPALMQLFGRGAWWLPEWLDRILPRLHVEPAEGDPAPTGEHPVISET
jgi:RND superfamily putative drug exporter